MFGNSSISKLLSKLTLPRNGTFLTDSHVYALSSPEAIIELLGLKSSQENCIWEVKTGSKLVISL